MAADIELAGNNLAEARKLLQQAIDKHPELVGPRVAMVSVAMRSGKLDDAKELLA
jgi:hypothetical protein